MNINKITLSLVVAGTVLFAAAPTVINASLADSTARMQPAAHIVTGYATSASAGIGR